MWHEPEDGEDHDPPPESVREIDREFGESSDPAPMRIAHIDTPELHLDDVARQNTWVEGLRSLSGEVVDHGPIEVLDGEIVPEGTLREAAPDGARLYEGTGNEGASLELQYRRAVLVVWRRVPGARVGRFGAKGEGDSRAVDCGAVPRASAEVRADPGHGGSTRSGSARTARAERSQSARHVLRWTGGYGTGTSVCPTIRRFSSSDHRRRVRARPAIEQLHRVHLSVVDT